MNPNILLFTDTGDHTFLYRPGGVYKVASILRTLGYKVLVNHFSTGYTRKGWQEIVKKYASKDLIWVGISTTFLTYPIDMWEQWKVQFDNSEKKFIDIDRYIPFHLNSKNKNKEKIVFDKEILEFLQQIFNVPVVVGGSQLTRNEKINELYSSNKKIIFVPGYGEDILQNLTESLINTGTWIDTRKNVYQFDREKFRRQPYIWTKEDLIEPEENLPLEINRGCAFKCGYCTYDHIGQRNHYKFPDTLYDEIMKNYNDHGTYSYSMLDDLYNDSNEKVYDLYENVFKKLPFKIEWSGYVRLDLFWRYPEQIELLQQSGLKACSFGIETLNDRAGKLVGKGLGKDKILSTLKKTMSTWKDSVLGYGLWIAGLPYEPIESWHDTVELQKKENITRGDAWNWLWINRNKKNMHLSAIDLAPEKYGYSFDEFGWKHEMGYNEQDSKDFCDYYKTVNQGKINSHFAYDIFRSAGFTHNDLATDKVNWSMRENIILQKSIEKRYNFNKKFIE